MRRRFLPVFILLACMTALHAAPDRKFIAFSLKNAEHVAESSDAAAQLGGMTDIIGIVHDADTGDAILVGAIDEGRNPLRLDSFVAAVRAVLREGTLPEVSIEPPTDGSSKQPVVFKGRLENTRLGREMLDADVLLKRLALGQLRTDLWGLPSYLAIAADRARADRDLPVAASRFWISVGDMPVSGGERQGAVLVHAAKIHISNKVATNIVPAGQTLADEYAQRVAGVFRELAAQFTPFARVQPIVKMVCLAQRIRGTQMEAPLKYWVEKYSLPVVATPATYELQESREEIRDIGRVLVLSGGIRINPQIRRLNAGDASALRQIVLASRPAPNALMWAPPLTGWNVTGEAEYSSVAAATNQDSGFSIKQWLTPKAAVSMPTPAIPRLSRFQEDYRFPAVQQTAGALRTPTVAAPSARTNLPQVLRSPSVPQFPTHNAFTPPSYARGVGGVMLSGAATVEGAARPEVELSRGGFALVVEGKSAHLAPDAFRRFVTALWAVYLSDEDPGISIDPMGPNSTQHLVRYIGNVVNTDLGRVMRDADYIMKKWAVGTERANIPGFKNPDDFIAQHGLQVANAHSRFWFVPEDMTFRRAGDVLLFSGGRMTVKTEYMSSGIPARAEPANERFAQLFTHEYERIAEAYPVYGELFEYAKLVSLAKYLKNSGVPLLWFLMANKDLVLTEDSPGTVNALAQGSKYYRNLTMSGGVNLKTGGRYVYDENALRAIQQAAAQMAANNTGQSTVSPAPAVLPQGGESFSFDLEKGTYSVVPQHTLTTGRDHHGNLYQTDLAMRKGGKPGFEMVRYFDQRRPTGGEFGKGWRFMIPYRIKPADDEMREFLNARIPVRMTVENLLTGGQDVLTFSTDRYSIAGYVPDRKASNQVVGLFLMSNATYRLADKFGNEFWFDQGGAMSDMLLAGQERIHYDYLRRMTDAFEREPYQMRPADSEIVEYRGQVLPKRLVIRDQIHDVSETLAFDLTQEIASYFPLSADNSRFRTLRWNPDRAYRLEDKHGNLVSFREDGRFGGMLPLKAEMVQSVAMGQQKLEIAYTIDSEGRMVVGKAGLNDGSVNVALHYEYNPDGTLANVRRTSSAHVARLVPFSSDGIPKAHTSRNLERR